MSTHCCDHSHDDSSAPHHHQWTLAEVNALFALPFNDLLYLAHQVHRMNFKANEVQLSTLLNIKTGSCPENCSYCPQSAHYNTGLKKEPLMSLDTVLETAKRAKSAGASRFCMGAAWRSPRDADLDKVIEMIQAIKAEGLETCVTLGMLTPAQAHKLKVAGLDYYNHNIDTSEEHYKEIITTRTFQDRIETIENVRQAGINVCCGGIVGMGEEVEDRASMLMTLANMKEPPESVPINMLVKIEGTPLENNEAVDPFDFIRTIAVARILMPKSRVRLSAGRTAMSEEMQALCHFAGANSIFYGETLLTTENPVPAKDVAFFEKLGLTGI
ncbi:biotin synthase BioB [Candidatus Paracaedibacter symbiosus]|uniref:biotin synthase BioB n=1 Tax=Candidatus Paracaedibacter symbiosus TaxID=244582 RepID=UPI0005094E38|nr:biotin synthase BioB [Candidatus Paracaedibacter symbiosus]